MPADKSPGPDGFTAHFFKVCWQIVKDDVIQAVQYFFYSGKVPSFVNSIYHALIPKKQNATDMKDYRPISCCNVIYKVISKVLANRLSRALPSLIGLDQSAFVKGRLIRDNVLLAREMLRSYNKSCVSPRCALKIDIMKAFDSVEWGYLLDIMAAMGIPPFLYSG
ncbi:Transposon TX1 uncharacterized 149 kDa protein [Linum perenne]